MFILVSRTFNSTRLHASLHNEECTLRDSSYSLPPQLICVMTHDFMHSVLFMQYSHTYTVLSFLQLPPLIISPVAPGIAPSLPIPSCPRVSRRPSPRLYRHASLRTFAHHYHEPLTVLLSGNLKTGSSDQQLS